MSLPPEKSTGRPKPKAKELRSPSISSDILDSDKYDMVLDKSNIILLGPTGSGKLLIVLLGLEIFVLQYS